jgi:hypothetical protein
MQQDDAKVVIAFYGVKRELESIQAFFSIASSWIREQGREPNKVSITYSDRKRKLISYNGAVLEFKKYNFSTVTDISLFSLNPGDTIPLRDFSAMGSYSLNDAYSIIAVKSCIAAMAFSNWSSVVKYLLESCSPTYGIGYERANLFGPVPYAIGIAEGLGFSGNDYEEAKHISRWGHTGMPQAVFRIGKLRDVYPWNFISNTHLSQYIHGESLQSWIRKNNHERGFLTQLSNALWLWEIQTDNLDKVRRGLQESGLLFF